MSTVLAKAVKLEEEPHHKILIWGDSTLWEAQAKVCKSFEVSVKTNLSD